MQRVRVLVGLMGLGLAISTPAWAQSFNVGDRVHIAQSGKDGTVLEVGAKMMDGGAIKRRPRPSGMNEGE